MKTINTGNIYEIFDDTLKTFDKLPTQTYVVRFSNNQGFFLEKYTDIEIKENKVYGVHLEKVHKVMNSFKKFNRNLGVILSGDKGIGKSLFAKLLAIEALKENIPLIVVDRFIPGIASYIESIEQEVMVLFDEFDKTFVEVRVHEGEGSPQAQLLSLFDGVSSGKKLFVITCNELRGLNDYLINRPGRFHYHFRFNYPSAKEVREYLEDLIPKEQYGEIDDVVSFSRKINLNYDCLRAIAFEIKSGLKFKEAIQDLNIINTKSERYNANLCFSNGIIAKAQNVYIDMFGDGEEVSFCLHDKYGRNYLDVTFNTLNCRFDPTCMMNIVKPENLKITFFDDDEYSDLIKQVKGTKVEYLSLSRCQERNIHYTV